MATSDSRGAIQPAIGNVARLDAIPRSTALATRWRSVDAANSARAYHDNASAWSTGTYRLGRSNDGCTRCADVTRGPPLASRRLTATGDVRRQPRRLRSTSTTSTPSPSSNDAISSMLSSASDHATTNGADVAAL